MKKIAIIAMATALPGEKGYTRFDFLAQMLVKNSYDVDLITSSFQHWEKKKRDKEEINSRKTNYNVILINEPGYKKNVDLNRLISHYILGKNLNTYLSNAPAYDLIYSVIPPNNITKIAGIYAFKKKIPFVIDVEDLWPEAMKMIFDIPIVSDILYLPLNKDAEYAYKLADGIIGTSDEYSNRPFKCRKKNIPAFTVYVGIELKKFDLGVQTYQNTIVKAENEFWVTYAGTLGTSYDIKTLIYALNKIKKDGYDSIKLKLLGNGPMKNELDEIVKAIDCDVEFLGYMPFEKMAAYLSKSDVLVNSFIKKAPQSIVNKIGDYLASGKPMINTCSSIEFKEKVEKNGFGINVIAEDGTALATAIKRLYADPVLCAQMGKRARMIAETEFDRSSSYEQIVDLIQNLLIKNDNTMK